MGPYRKGLRLSAVSTVLLILLAVPVVAQLPTATILGVAKDTSGGVLPDVTVTVTNVDTGLTRTVKTSDDGEYRVPELPVGRYEVKGEHAGFKIVNRMGITLEVTRASGDQPGFRGGIGGAARRSDRRSANGEHAERHSRGHGK